MFIVADDLGYADLGCYGNDLTETPRLDRLAGEGVKFTRYYCAGPACMPTRASILSGKYPIRLYRWTKEAGKPGEVAPWDPLPLKEVTFAETLKANGYATGYIGKWHLGAEPLFPDQQGFDWVAASGKYWKLPCFFHPYRVEQLEGEPDRGYLTHVLTGEAEGYLEQRKDGKPFFLFVSHYAPHIPIQGEPAVVEKYRKKLKPGDQRNPVYSAMVEALDVSVGRILDTLDATGLARNTVVIFTSDNGGFLGYGTEEERKRQAEEKKKSGKGKKGKGSSTSMAEPDPCEVPYPVVTSNSPLRSGKATLYEGGIRVPLIVRWPGVTKPGTTTAVPAISTDLYPTFLDAAGAKPDAAQRLDGTSLLPVLRGSAPAGDRDLFVLFGTGTVIRGRYKLIVPWKDGKDELYDLETDPGETAELSAKLPAVAADLRARLDAWFRASLPPG